MAPARTQKTKPARDRAAKRRKTLANKTLATQSSGSWQIGAGILALVVMLGAAIYAVSLNDTARLNDANFVERPEITQQVKDSPGKVRRNLPVGQESAPAQ